MKLSTKTILPILLISAMLILLVGCFIIPPEEEPGYTAGSIAGTMTRPEVCCLDPQGELVGDPLSPNICIELCDDTVDWYAWANVQVVLTTWVDSEEVMLATTVTDENGNYLFSDVSPGINYIITAICPTDEDFVIKDVAEEVVEGGTCDAGIADAESTVLALCLEGLGEIGVNSDLINLDDFRNHFRYEPVICEVCDKLADCKHAMPVWVCELTELCPGWTPGEGEGEGEGEPCDDNIAPSINSVFLDATEIVEGDTVDIVAATSYDITINASDDGIKDPLTYSATVDGGSYGPTSSNQITVIPLSAGQYSVNLSVYDGCDTTPWGPVTVVICTEIEGLGIAIDPVGGTVCDDECATLGPVTISFTDATPDLDINDLTDARLTWDTTPAGISFNASTGEVCLTGDPNTYTLGVTYEDECGETVYGTVDVTFELCCIEPILDLLEFKVKMSSDGSDFENWTPMFGYEYDDGMYNPDFDPNTFTYDINTGISGSPKFGFKATGCGTLQLKYNWYRGLQCGDSWLEDDGSAEVPPDWRDIDIAGVYPELDSENTLCQHGGNILIIKVIDDDLDEQTYTININRGP